MLHHRYSKSLDCDPSLGVRLSKSGICFISQTAIPEFSEQHDEHADFNLLQTG